jgi:acetyl esterase
MSSESRPQELTGWVSQIFHRPIASKPRTSPDEIPGAREFWSLDNLPHLSSDLPALGAAHEGVLLRERAGTRLTADIYVPEGAGPFPTLLYVHGGSWVLWSARHLRKLCMQIAARGFVVVNIEYGLAPEHPWPWAVEDTIYAARWVSKNIDQYQGRPENIFIGGDSAGANLSAAAISAVNGLEGTTDPGDLPGVAVSFAGAVLLYGIFDFPLLFAEPGSNFAGGIIETTWNLAYLGPNFVRVHREPLVSPYYAPNLAAFPPTYISCGDRDALLPQSLRFTSAIVAAKVPTTVSVVEGADHAFLMMPDVIGGAAHEFERIVRWMSHHSAS